MGIITTEVQSESSQSINESEKSTWKERFNNAKSNIQKIIAVTIFQKSKEATEPKERNSLVWRTLTVGMSLLFFFVYSKLLFIVFMGSEGFFSYDLFSDGSLGMEIFFGTTEFMIIIISVSLFPFLLPLFKWKFNPGPFPKWWFLGALAYSVLMWSIVLLPIFNSSSKFSIQEQLTLFGIVLFIAVHVATAFHCHAKRSVISLLVLQMLLLTYTAISAHVIVETLKTGLKTYGVGGDLPLVVVDREGNSNDGTLIFLSPRNVYMRSAKDGSLQIFTRDECKIQIFKKMDAKSNISN